MLDMTRPTPTQTRTIEGMTSPQKGGKKTPYIKKKTAVDVLNIRLSKELKDGLLEIAESYGMTMSEYMRALALSELRAWNAVRTRSEIEKTREEEKAG